MMDDELEEAQSLTAIDLERMLREGKPADIVNWRTDGDIITIPAGNYEVNVPLRIRPGQTVHFEPGVALTLAPDDSVPS